MGTSPDRVDTFLKNQDAQIQQSDRQILAKHQREVQLAISADARQQQRNAIDTAMVDKLYKVEAQANLDLYQTWLLQHDPHFLDRMNQESRARYNTLTHKGEDLQFEGAEARQSFRQNLLSHTMYQSDLRAREVIEYASMQLDLSQVTEQGSGFNPEETRPDSQQFRHRGRGRVCQAARTEGGEVCGISGECSLFERDREQRSRPELAALEDAAECGATEVRPHLVGDGAGGSSRNADESSRIVGL